MKKVLIVISSLIFVLALSACGANEAAPAAADAASTAAPTAVTEAAPSTGNGMMGMGGGMMGGGNSMMARHSAPIPADYKGLSSPVAADEASLERGAQQYTTLCATCHGDGGMGDGPAGAALDPAPSAIAHTSQMMGDDYLFWRISEGGAFDPFNSTMIAWKPVLSEEQRWDVINYMRALGTGQVQPGMGMGGAAFDPASRAGPAHRNDRRWRGAGPLHPGRGGYVPPRPRPHGPMAGGQPLRRDDGHGHGDPGRHLGRHD